MKTPFSRHSALAGSEKSMPAGKLGKRLNKDELLSVTLKVRSKNEFPDLMDVSVNETFKPMTRTSYEKHFGISSGDMRRLEDFAHHFGLSMIETNAGSCSVELRGSIAQMEEAFKVEMNNYEQHSGDNFRGRSGAIHIPEELSEIVEGVFGLDNRTAARIKLRVFDSKRGSVQPRTGSQIAFFPNQLARLYHYPEDATGKNQCIGIIELGGGFRKKDLTDYFGELNLKPPKVIAVSVDGGHNNPSSANSADGEVMLDIEVAAGVAPDARIVVYFAPNTDKGFLDAIQTAIHDTRHKPSVISISWGSSENEWTKQSLQAYNKAFAAAAMMGVTVCVAAGDSGSGDNVEDGMAHVDFPASSPYALACGGTKLILDDTGKITSEIVWHESNSSATGGGISEIFPEPRYQQGTMIPLSVNSGFKGRGIPDVAAVADPETGYHVRVDGQSMVFGGTSAVAPLMSGLIALINEKLHKKVGFIHPKLYAHPEVCNDITEGNNRTTADHKGYNAQEGWDACTGFGSADGEKLMNALH